MNRDDVYRRESVGPESHDDVSRRLGLQDIYKETNRQNRSRADGILILGNQKSQKRSQKMCQKNQKRMNQKKRKQKRRNVFYFQQKCFWNVFYQNPCGLDGEECYQTDVEGFGFLKTENPKILKNQKTCGIGLEKKWSSS
ncbi:Protein CBG26524 [Caenorhabditis briggsae]|uniref:Uncharacterized protein n=2 Tax=Caenorhabditis briggsae TaxID=6238 RepID=A0AAE9EZJ9_CAEBR|nr:Protein CBG26524 [Caenorhabditis briggsae]ULT97969.1 hypothetical protein L3Y34_005658 [Caenorhabditis briggsae]UMM31141.1 hypothetical protein L5515_012741 [Caenorhabditis briggsae]CAR99485.1 Protein CBG26524 [Caenorhabditis briggsae]